MRVLRHALGLVTAFVLVVTGGTARAQNAPIADSALAHADALRLTDEQARQLELVRREADRRAAALLSSRQNELLSRPPPRPSVGPDTVPLARPTGQESKLVEFETSEAIAERLIKWAQWFALAVGAPMAILATVLAVAGVRSYRDFRARLRQAGEAAEQRVAEAGASIDARLAEAGKEADRREQEAAGLEAKFTNIHQRLEQISKLEHSVRELADKVDKVEQYVDFQKSRALTPQLQASLEASLGRYVGWLSKIGCQTDKRPSVSIDSKLKDQVYYVQGRISVGENHAREPDVVLRPYTHHVLSAARPRRSAQPSIAVQYGLVNYLICSFENDPLSGGQSAGGHAELTTNDVRLDLEPSWESDMRMGMGWGASFWEMRAIIGAEPTDRLLVEAWTTAKSGRDPRAAVMGFMDRLAELMADRRPAAKSKILAIFQRRGLDLSKPKAQDAELVPQQPRRAARR
ncbi:hypothetical protein [Phenylobacterium sp.]|uniref:hypothetical protein n=1 Tax=Phenylobacterium sp. TaxID=1871053 RepID=UPI002F3FE1C3